LIEVMMIRTVEPLAHVRSHPEMYLPDGEADPFKVAARLEADAVASGAKRTFTAHRDGRWIVAADTDWLAAAGVAPRELFRRLVPSPRGGRNTFRSEVLLGAFADAVVTWSGENVEPIQGDHATLLDLRDELPGAWQRAIAFRLAPVVAPQSQRKRPTRVFLGYSSEALNPLFSFGPAPFVLAGFTPEAAPTVSAGAARTTPAPVER
jgi:hypothetical protein